MTDPNDPGRADAVRRALGCLLDLLAREVARDLAPPAGDPAARRPDSMFGPPGGAAPGFGPRRRGRPGPRGPLGGRP